MHEVVDRIPHSILRWGITVIFLVIVSLLLISWFIRYPDLLPAKVTITTTPPPLALVSRISGSLRLLKQDNESIQDGDLVAYIQSNASPTAVLSYEKLLMGDTSLPIQNLQTLGDLQAGYRDWINATIALRNLQNNRIYDIQIGQLGQQLGTYRKLKISLEKQQLLQQQELTLAGEKFKTDSILFNQKSYFSHGF